jgi:4-amino-4-deoxy-L-arabinose transferase-like glycosyltransferase
VGRNRQRQDIVAYITLAMIVVFCIVSVNYRTITTPWFTMTEEFPYAQEVLRFLGGNFRQHFFDIPGTPFITVVTAMCAVILGVVSRVSGQASRLAALGFERLDLVYLVMRSVSLAAFAGATWLVFLTARRFASRWAALLGAAVFAAHPIMAATIYYTRIEPFGTLVVSASIMAWLRAVETGQWRWYATTGFLSGLAMAARFPLVLATLPVFLFYTLARPQQFTAMEARVDRRLGTGLFGVALFGGALAALRVSGLLERSRLTALFFLSTHLGYQRAPRAIATLWILLALVALGVLVIAVIPPGQRLAARYRDSSLVTVAVFFPVGVLVGVPTLIGAATYLLTSIELFIQRNAYVQPNVGRGIWNVLSLYLVGGGGLTALLDPRSLVDPRHFPPGEPGVLFNIPLLVLFGCGLLAASGANRWLYGGVIFACVIGVGSQFGKLHTPRHLAGWLPWFCIVIAVGGDWIARRTAASQRSIAPVFAMCLALLLWQRAALTAPMVDRLVETGTLQTRLNRWLQANVPPDKPVFHTCCEPVNPSVVFGWMKSNGVAVPEKYLDNGSRIWFGQLSALRAAGEGYVITSRYTYPGQYVDYYRQMNPAELVDPYHDSRFELRHTIAAHNIYDVFHFVMCAPRTSRSPGPVPMTDPCS